MSHTQESCFRKLRPSSNSVYFSTEAPRKLAQTFAEPPKMLLNLSKNDFPLVVCTADAELVDFCDPEGVDGLGGAEAETEEPVLADSLLQVSKFK